MKLLRQLCGTVLIMEAIVIGLAIPVAIVMEHLRHGVAGGVGGALAVSALLLSAVVGRPGMGWALWAGTALQVLVIAASRCPPPSPRLKSTRRRPSPPPPAPTAPESPRRSGGPLAPGIVGKLRLSGESSSSGAGLARVREIEIGCPEPGESASPLSKYDH